jgi:hypothetical protein
MAKLDLQDVSWERMIGAVEDVRNRMIRVATALSAAGVPYAIVGGNAVAAWVSRVDRAAVRNTADIDVLLRRVDFDAANKALSAVGFVHQLVFGVDVFLDGADARPRDAVHVIFAGEFVRAGHLLPAPDVAQSEVSSDLSFVTLEALVRMKLTAFRDKDRMHIRDLIDVGLVDAAWVARLPVEIGQRLQELLDTPDG